MCPVCVCVCGACDDASVYVFVCVTVKFKKLRVEFDLGAEFGEVGARPY